MSAWGIRVAPTASQGNADTSSPGPSFASCRHTKSQHRDLLGTASQTLMLTLVKIRPAHQ